MNGQYPLQRVFLYMYAPIPEGNIEQQNQNGFIYQQANHTLFPLYS